MPGTPGTATGGLDDEEDKPVWEIEAEAEGGSTMELLIDAVSGERIR